MSVAENPVLLGSVEGASQENGSKTKPQATETVATGTDEGAAGDRNSGVVTRRRATMEYLANPLGAMASEREEGPTTFRNALPQNQADDVPLPPGKPVIKNRRIVCMC
jgi:hypothetical protein